MNPLKTLSLALTLGFALTMCGSGGEKDLGGSQPAIEVDPTEIIYSTEKLDVGVTGTEHVVVRNTGTSDLKVSRVELSYDPVDPEAEAAKPAIALDEALLELPRIIGIPDSSNSDPLMIRLEFTRYDDELERTATLRIHSNDPNAPIKEVPISTLLPRPLLRVVPETVDLGRTAEGETATQAVTLRNSGSTDLELYGFLFTASNANFKMTLDDLDDTTTDPVHEPSAEQNDVVLDEAIVLPPDQATSMMVSYTAFDPSPASGQIVLYSNDDRHPTGMVVAVLANQEGSCIEVIPEEVKFGGRVPAQQYVLPVEIKNCADAQQLQITGLDFADGIDGCKGEFCVDIPPELGNGQPLNPDNPLIVETGTSIIVNVIYNPQDQSPVDEETSQPVRDEETLVITSNAFVATKQVMVSGFGIPDDCPVAMIVVEEGEEVIPQTVLHLHGESSYSSTGNITKYEWSVEQPALSASAFIPTPSYPTPSFEANVAGKYIFRLHAWDEYGRKSCYPAEAVVFVVPDEAIHVELLWTTPGDNNPNDEGPYAGSDLDLHFAHPNASQYDLDGDGMKDPWFDSVWDTFWFYPIQNWGSATANNDDPSLDRDDVDGFGPENINLDVPEVSKTYSVGVNYWDDHTYGQSFATVRVYIYAQLVYEVQDVMMVDHDMWWVATIDWPSAQVKAKLNQYGNYWITHDYHHPQFYQP